MEKVRPEYRQTAAKARNAYVRAKDAQKVADAHMDEAKRLILQLRVQGVSTWTLAQVVGISQKRIRQMTGVLTNRA